MSISRKTSSADRTRRRCARRLVRLQVRARKKAAVHNSRGGCCRGRGGGRSCLHDLPRLGVRRWRLVERTGRYRP